MALRRKMIRDGGYVAGAVCSEDYYSARYEITDSLKQPERFKGAKYVDADKGTVNQDMKKLLDEGKADSALRRTVHGRSDVRISEERLSEPDHL